MTCTPATRSGATARRLGIDPREYAYDIQLQREGHQLIYTPLFNFVDGSLDAVREMITSPVAMFGLSDGGALRRHLRRKHDHEFHDALGARSK